MKGRLESLGHQGLGGTLKALDIHVPQSRALYFIDSGTEGIGGVTMASDAWTDPALFANKYRAASVPYSQ